MAHSPLAPVMVAILGAYTVVLVLGAGWLLRAWWSERRLALLHAERIRARGQDEAPATLHPVIDPAICIGSGSCVDACPEQHALVLVRGRAHLADAGGCVGHGACKDACPVGAITLVFGSARRGVDIPELDHEFQTNVPGLYIAGELGGMGLVSNAVRQGVKVVDAIAAALAASKREPGPGVASLLVVGAGPAGIGATLAARAKGIDVRTIEQAPDIGGAVRSYTRQKVVMTQPVHLPLYGTVRLHRTNKQALIELWMDVLQRAGLTIEHGVRFEGALLEDGVFVARTSKGEMRAHALLLAAGRRGSPRRLGVPGDDLPHVLAQLDDPEDHRGLSCVVAGGGDSAVEAALELAEVPATKVSLVHRGADFDRARPANRARLAAAEAAGALTVLRRAVVTRVHADAVEIGCESGEPARTPADRVFALLGADAPLGLLQACGVQVRTHYGDAAASGDIGT
ncbi:MAG: NAD(P)-binding domain-containing protein [Micrococcales bacterium]|nr:NAD(P)-binding domain-containing protein [Micrococcales bacterium]